MKPSFKGREAIVNDKPVNEYFLTQKASANLNLREVPGVLKAENYGFASIWFNHRHRQKTLPVHPLFEVDNYAQFQRILKKDFAPTALR